ncbi:oxidoreductase [Clostridium weizhouense]|uniref:FAD-dependent oxidoreductase n=1 Tax=Clostridium weizhouense TaxID=2859781 RepID=A0ABS7APV6_9CLOT|nr:FAD-dependent oxidoreductase [Clostridium weizhouense]MBW6410691.1 FAD-dependent oxidoreductase [Clostridium weizhouense]
MSENYEIKLKQLENSYGDWFNGKFQISEMTDKYYPYDNIFSPIQVNRITIKNRLVMGPMGNICMADETGRPSEKMIAYFEERAKGGVGLITTGLIPTSYGIDNSLSEKGDLSIFPRIDRSRTVFSGWRDLAAVCHAHDSTLFIQLTPGMGRVGNPQCLVTKYKFPVSASWNPNFYMSLVPCKRLSDREIDKIIKQTGQASADAKAANIDGVYLHGHEGYLMEQLTNTAFNRRKIGKYSDWQRFGIDTVKEIRNRCGKNYPIMYRIDLSLALNETYKEKMDTEKSLKKFKNERTIAQTLDYMKNLVEAGVDIFDVDLGCYDNWWLPHPPATMPSGCFLDISKIVKDYFEKEGIKSNVGLKVPVVAVGKLGYPDLAEKALRDGQCDMVMLARPLLADPELPNKAYRGDVEDICPCIGCQEACINEFVEGGHPQCAVNPRTGFESELPEEIQKASKEKNIAVIGAGPAGIMAALTLLKRGHKVDLYEKDREVGGMLIPGGSAKIKYELKNYLIYLKHSLDKHKDDENFNLLLSTSATIETLKFKDYDVVMVSTGATQIKPPIEGINNENVVFAIDVLKDPSLVKDAKSIVVVGGGVVGCETAYFLKYELDKKVSVIEMMSYFMNHTCTANRGHILHYLEKSGVDLHNCTILKKINKDSVDVLKNISKTVPNPYNTWQPILPENMEVSFSKEIEIENKKINIKADMIVLSTGIKSDNMIYYNCVKQHIAKEIYNIGDSRKPGRVFEVVRTAYRKSLTI